jgi:hypothetical protein
MLQIFFELHEIKIYTHRTLPETLYIKHKHTNNSVNTQIHTEIKVNICMQHIQEIPITITIVINAHTITHKNKHVNNNAPCKFITQLALILVIMSPTRPSTNLSALDHTIHHSQQ